MLENPSNIPLILIVEDDPDSLANTTLLLELEGFTVIGAQNATVGLDLIQSRKPSLVICDILMPGMNGLELLAEVRRHPESAPTPFLFLTALTDYHQLRSAMNAGADDYLTKPYSADDLLGAVTARLHRLGNWPQHNSPGADAASVEALSHREREILSLIGQGLSSLQIADRLNISRRTVDSHRVHLLNKLGLDSASSLIRFAVTHTGNTHE